MDPKVGELCVIRMKPIEILVEVRSGVDVQIAVENYVKGRKTNRTDVVAGFSRNFSQDR